MRRPLVLAALVAVVLVPALAVAAIARAGGNSTSLPRNFLSATTATSTPVAANFRALPGASASFGQLDSTAYRIEMPDQWNGELVLWAHGFAGFDRDVTVSNPPDALRRELINNGFAWAASSYRENGYVPATAAEDTLALKRFFAHEHGDPKRTYLLGESMGGAVVTLSLEQYPSEYSGALATCGALGGEEEIDYLLSWWLAAEFFARSPLPIGQGAEAVGTALRDHVLPGLGNVRAPNPAGQQFESVVRNLTGGPRPFFQRGFRDQYLANFGLLLLDPDRQTAIGRAATNVGVRYRIDPALGMTDDQVNSGIRRLAVLPPANGKPDPNAARTTGRISTPLLTLHNTGDLLVPIQQEVRYREKVQAAGGGNLLVQRAVRDSGHCQFSDAELTTSWRDLVHWVRDGARPTGDDLSGDLRDVGRAFTQPLRGDDPGVE